MPDYRCPVHDIIFFASVDTRPPGAQLDPVRNLPAHPNTYGHPECPQCNALYQSDSSQTKTVI